MAEPASPDSGQIVRLVSESLRRLIRAHIPELAAESAVVFDSPADIDSHDENKLSLYLYQIEHNPWLRNLPPTLSGRGGEPGRPNALEVTPAPLVVDLVYMLVPYARSAEMELVLVDKLVRLFHDMPALIGPWLHPLLRQAGNERIAIVPDQNSIESLRALWAGFPNKSYKLTKLYTLSPVRIPAGQPYSADMVTETELTLINMRPQPDPAGAARP
ncbi:DUF4255 domain-containing protein [Chitinimonas arctica]|uniref:DUF4255 domain-containing protein n=1 Tax=Chitinimonas arctica TaxID=2594795 RepID=A0A516SIY7_9NEIS|nr:DUF4255 domain-containing protein [Chitinimonas arctica]QDQ28008.1 DUF4255 domain-containing protein [Chitinimonas arctica]